MKLAGVVYFYLLMIARFAALRLCQTDGASVLQTSCRLRSQHQQWAPQQPERPIWPERSRRRTGCRGRPPSNRETPVSSRAHKHSHQHCQSEVWKHFIMQLFSIFPTFADIHCNIKYMSKITIRHCYITDVFNDTIK